MNGQAKKLREKLMNCPDNEGWCNPNIHRAKNLEQITDDFAVKFAEWIYNRSIPFPQEVNYTTTELLQIFKDKYYDR